MPLVAPACSVHAGSMQVEAASVAEAVELVLKTVFRRPAVEVAAGGYLASRPESGTEIHFEGAALLDAALFIRRHASPHLRSLSVEDLQKMLVDFMNGQMDLFRLDWWSLPEGARLADHVSSDDRAELAAAMAASPIFAPSEVLFLYPITIATVARPFRSASFFLLPPKELARELTRWYDFHEIKSGKHPPIPMHAEMKLADVTSWLGVRAPIDQLAERMRNAVLGAIALLPHPLQRYLFSMRTVPTGHMSFDARAAFQGSGACTPALSERLEFGDDDNRWMAVLADRLASDEDRARKAMLALQYFYRAWVRDPATRVAPLCGALDALFGDREAATRAMVSAVGAHLGPTFDAVRAKRLAKLRAGVIHGGAPNIYEASVYQQYYANYRRDPIRDLELATARCLQAEIFGDALIERPHTYADLVRQVTDTIV